MKNHFENIAIIGSSGAIGNSFVNSLEKNDEIKSIYSFSRNPIDVKSNKIFSYEINFENEKVIENASLIASKHKPLDLVIVASGILSGSDFRPEKSLKELSIKNFDQLFFINTIGPALIAKYFLPKLNKNKISVFAALSARVGSISDNYLGGWYSYRASKAALNMIIKNASIELSRSNKNSVVIGLHPGTVDSKLSKSFQKSINKDKIFTPDYSVKKLLEIIYELQKPDTGKIFAWDGKEIFP
tara:strand:- start:324 stop:1052 length:729 start_codon:yes stop_codon:yes gene_type:complete